MRGSTPAVGAGFSRYGGNTSCVALSADGGAAPALVLDAGTGLQRLSADLGGAAFCGTILLGHLHWDHTHGLPFFSAGDRPDSRVRLLMPRQGGLDSAVAVLERAMSPPHFPIVPGELRGDWAFEMLDEGCHSFEGFSVVVREVPHKGGVTYGYRVSDGRSSVAYLSDHDPTRFGDGPDGLGEYHAAAVSLAEGVDVLIHDGQHTAAEFPQWAGYGHSAIEYAIGLGAHCGVGKVVVFHHDPRRTDDELDALATSHPTALFAAEGLTLDL